MDITGRSPKQAFLLQNHHVMRTPPNSLPVVKRLTSSSRVTGANRGDLKDRVTRCLTLKSPQGRVYRGIEV
jgi:hypothetical protein